VGPAAVTQVTDLNSDIFIDLRTSLMVFDLGSLSSLFLGKGNLSLNLLLLNEVLLDFSAEITFEHEFIVF
jgi:hypothetical protein